MTVVLVIQKEWGRLVERGDGVRAGGAYQGWRMSALPWRRVRQLARCLHVRSGQKFLKLRGRSGRKLRLKAGVSGPRALGEWRE